MRKDLLEEKIAQYKAGDRRAFDAVYDMTHRAVYFRILYVVRDKMYAEDILHDAYLRAMQNISSYIAGTDFIAWLTRIGKNLALNFLEKKKREELTAEIAHSEEIYENIEAFLPVIWKYTNITELTPHILNELIEKIVVHEKVVAEDGSKSQQVDIHYKFIGCVNWKREPASYGTIEAAVLQEHQTLSEQTA